MGELEPRPDTDDAYALSSVRKAYRLLNGGTFQDFVGLTSTPAPLHANIDWMEAYRHERDKNELLTSQVIELEAQLRASKDAVTKSNHQTARDLKGEVRCSPRIERVQAQIMSALHAKEKTAQEISLLTGLHLRTVQRRLQELIDEGKIDQINRGVTPTYKVASSAT